MPSSAFIKVEWMREKVIHKDSTRCIVESLRAGINKRKAISVNTSPPQLQLLHSEFIMVMLVYYVDIILKDMRTKLTCTGQVFRYDISGRQAITDTNLAETLQRLLQYDQEQERNFGLFDDIFKSCFRTQKNLAMS